MAAYQTGPVSEPPMLNTEIITQKVTSFTTGTATKDKPIGYLDVFVHQARDIHNICIYHKQDVYAKLCLTNDPDVSCSTKVINGGGRNPVFDDGLRLDVRTVEASLKCEIWMLSRVRNYLEDQLLGFALVPLADIVMADGKIVQEFSMTSTDLLHTPAGFVQLSLSYVGSSPDVIPISAPNKSVVNSSGNDSSVPCELENIEFPDLNVVKENQIMVSKYFEMETLSYESSVKVDNKKRLQSDEAVPVTEIFNKNLGEYREESPQSCVSTTDYSTGTSVTPQSVSEPSDTTVAASPTGSQRETNQDATDGEADSSEVPLKAEVVKPVISINLQPGESVVQEDIVNMYMKSMQQFTESLAKMKLPLDVENSSPSTENNTDSSTTEKPSPSKGAKVFYGSRAFF
uniref:C2 domain-containing protein n=1 Tax=Leersia perrieri TaxID=77586 RepID=A0A0D9VQN4_9ORYZ